MPLPAARVSRLPFWVWAAIPVILAAWLRWRGLDKAGPFVDEGANILTALDPRMLGAFEPLAQGRPWLVYLFRPVGWLPIDVLVVARIMSAGAGLVTQAALGWTLLRLAGRPAAWCGLWLWAVLPFAVFHERLALQDPFVTALLASAVALMTAGSLGNPRRNWLWFTAAGGLFGCAFLLKVSAAVALPWLGCVYLAVQRHTMRPVFDHRPFLIALGALTPVLTLGADLPHLGDGLDRYSAFPSLTEPGYVASAFDRLKTWLDWYAGYGGWPLLLLGVVALALAGRKWRRSPLALGFASAWLVTLCVTTLIYHNLNARYILVDHLPLVLFLALAVGSALAAPGRLRVAAAALLLLTAGRWGFVSWMIGTDPERADVPAGEIAQYYTGPWSGRGVKEVRRYLTGYADRHRMSCLVLTHWFLRPGCYGLLLAAQNDARISVAPIMIYEAAELATARRALQKAAQGQRVAFFILYEGSLYPAYPWLDAPGSPARRVLDVPRGSGETFTLYQFEP